MKNVIKNQIASVLKTSKFYQNKIGDKIDESLDFDKWFKNLPFTTKKELLEDQRLYPPFGSFLNVNKNSIKRVHQTSGTTNKPFIIAMTNQDIEDTVSLGKTCFSNSGLKESDIVFHCLSYNMWIGGYTDHQSLEATGATVVPFGVGNTRKLIDSILLIKPTAIHCTPSYLSKIELVLQNEYGMKPIDLGLRIGLLGAESGIQNMEFRRNIEKKWGMKAMNANYGMGDCFSIFASEFEDQTGLFFRGEDYLYAELINPETEESISIEDGNEGELVLTNIKKEAQPLIKYRTSDIIRITKSNEEIKGFFFEVLGRSDDMITVKGVNVYVNVVENVIFNYLELLTGLFQIHINEMDPVSDFHIYLELKEGLKYPGDNFTNHFINDCKTKFGISPSVKYFFEGQLPRTQGKTKKLFRDIK